MTSVVTNGSMGAGTGPISLSTAFSDRAGEEAPGQTGPAPVVESLDRVLRNLDSLTESRDAPDSGLPAVQSPEAEGEDSSAAGEPTRRESILDAASALFAERGYHGASLRDISRRVGISHPGMLHHFSSKEVLLGAVIDRLEAHAQGLLDSVGSISSSPATLIAALGGPWDPRKHSMALLATLSAEVVNPEHPGRYRIARLRLVHEHVLVQVFSALEERGRLVEGATASVLARQLFSLLLSLTVREHTVRELQRTCDADPIADVEAFVRLVCTEG